MERTRETAVVIEGLEASMGNNCEEVAPDSLVP